MKESFRFSRLLLSVALIAVGGAALYFFITSFASVGAAGVLALVLYIPTMLMLVVLPLYAGFGLLIEQLRFLAHSNHTGGNHDET